MGAEIVQVWIRILTVVFVMCMTSQPVTAESLEILLERGDYQTAYAQAQALESERAGEPRFDFLYGLAALESGNVQEAVFALERVLVNIPEDHRARLELARAYFMLGNYERSEALFNIVLAADPPPKVRENIQQFLYELSQRNKMRDHQLTGFAEFALGYDSNINSATTEDNISLPIGLVLNLGETSRELGDEFAEINAGANYLKLLRKDMGYFLSASLSERQNDSYNLFDTRLLGLSGGYVYQAEGQSFRVPLHYQYLAVDRDRFRSSLGVGLEWSTVPLPATQLILFSQWAQQRHVASEEIRDVDLTLLGLGVSYRIEPILLTLSLSAYLADESPKHTDGEHFGRDYAGLHLLTSWRPHHDHEFLFTLSGQQAGHDAAHPSFGAIREDDYRQFSIEWGWSFNRQWRYSIGIDHSSNDSNLTIYTYSRSQQHMSLRYVF